MWLPPSHRHTLLPVTLSNTVTEVNETPHQMFHDVRHHGSGSVNSMLILLYIFPAKTFPNTCPPAGPGGGRAWYPPWRETLALGIGLFHVSLKPCLES